MPKFVCPIIDNLIESGVLSGAKWNNGANEVDSLCVTPDKWRNDPGFLQFASTARWIYDPADGANFMDRLATKDTRVLVQGVVDDPVVPNISTDQLGGQFRLAGLQPRRGQILDFIDWYGAQFESLGVEVRYNTPMDADDVAAFGGRAGSKRA